MENATFLNTENQTHVSDSDFLKNLLIFLRQSKSNIMKSEGKRIDLENCLACTKVLINVTNGNADACDKISKQEKELCVVIEILDWLFSSEKEKSNSIDNSSDLFDLQVNLLGFLINIVELSKQCRSKFSTLCKYLKFGKFLIIF